MAFVLPRRFADAPPEPLDGSAVMIDAVPARLVAAKAFAGIATPNEVRRQEAALLAALEADGSVQLAEGARLSVLQYNSPLTVPWRRRNEVALVVTERAAPAAEAEGAAEAPADAEGAQRGAEPAADVVFPL